MKYILVTDSGCDVPQQFIDQYNIEIVPMHVTLGDETFDDYDIPGTEIFNYYEKTGELPKTSGSTPEDNAKVYRRIREQHPDTPIIHVAYSAVTTVSYNSARIAAEDFENIHIVDSKNCTAGAATIVISTAEFMTENPDATPEEIVAYVENIRERTRFVFMPSTLDYLKAGGRVSNGSYLIASLLKINPTIELQDGYLVAAKKYRGEFKKSATKMLKDFLNNGDYIENSFIVGGTPHLSTELREAAEEKIKSLGYKIRSNFEAGAVISTHGGPGVFGVTAILKA